MIGPVTPVVVLPDITGRDQSYTPSSTDIYVDSPALPDTITVEIRQPSMPLYDRAMSAHEASVANWDAYVGQKGVKSKLRMHIDSALARMETLPHILLDGPPGTGKTTLARLIAQEMGVKVTVMSPPFSTEALYQAMVQQQDWDILFIDEIHKLADNGPRGAEALLTAMEEKMLYLETGAYRLADFAIIGATTNGSKLPQTVRDRFAIKPFFRRYTEQELIKITYGNFCKRYGVDLTPQVLVAIARACRSTPRVARDFVTDARALQDSLGRQCTPDELLTACEVEPDGMTLEHVKYIVGVYQFGAARKADDTLEYRMGEETLRIFLDQDKYGLSRLERFVIEKGLVNKTGRGRVLTDAGVLKAQDYIRRGRGEAA